MTLPRFTKLHARATVAYCNLEASVINVFQWSRIHVIDERDIYNPIDDTTSKEARFFLTEVERIRSISEEENEPIQSKRLATLTVMMKQFTY